mmetsp:Transcript_100675/g.307711  ORF Transcript_100675/g.307711 Transcript_100675/m.307711 type:complete len:216 (+) Transcript_100675:468-1115(+)
MTTVQTTVVSGRRTRNSISKTNHAKVLCAWRGSSDFSSSCSRPPKMPRFSLWPSTPSTRIPAARLFNICKSPTNTREMKSVMSAAGRRRLTSWYVATAERSRSSARSMCPMRVNRVMLPTRPSTQGQTALLMQHHGSHVHIGPQHVCSSACSTGRSHSTRLCSIEAAATAPDDDVTASRAPSRGARAAGRPCPSAWSGKYQQPTPNEHTASTQFL